MVMFNMWSRTASDPKIGSEFPMSGEGTGLGVPAPALAGFLGKLPDICPWCAARGLVSTLRTYRTSHQDVVTLCPSPQCLFPLVSKPLLLSGRTPGQKRTSPASPKGGHLTPPPKQQRLSSTVGPDGGVSEVGMWAESEAELEAGMSGELEPAVRLEEENEPGLVDKPNVGLWKESEAAVIVDESEPDTGPLDGSKVEHGAEVMNNSEQKSVLPEDTGLVRLEEGPGPARGEELIPGVFLREELTVAPPHLFWKNEQNLCWLDCLLVALVQCQALREHRRSLVDGASVVGQLLASYDQAGLLVKAREQTHQQVVKVPAAILREAQANLDDLRMSIFKRLQPKLQCKLGDWETPVFALPILLKLDAGAVDLFQHTFEWSFECAACGHTFSNRCEKSITTFTQVRPNWHPLSAVHRAPCSRCHHKDQRRKMVLERLAPLFVLHFVEGLPQNDISKYAFDFQGAHYSVTTVIQYCQHRRHFVTWLRTTGGVWLEFDDLKHPRCTAHKELPVPADQIHVVFWEVQGPAKGVCHSPRHSLVLPALHDEEDIIRALTADDSNVGTTLPDISIGEGTLQDAFQGLSHSDIITLTLVEVKVDAQGAPLEAQPGQEALSPPTAERNSPSTNSPAAAIVRPPVSDSPQKRGPRAEREKPPQATQAVSAAVGPPLSGVPSVCSSALVSSAPNARWSSLMSRHPCLQSTPLALRRSAAPSPPKVPQKVTDSNFPVKAADMFVGFKSNKGGSKEPCQSTEPVKQNGDFKLPGPPPSVTSLQRSAGAVRGTVLPKASPKPDAGRISARKDLGSTDALRRKLLKKLKAKKKQLAALNQLLTMNASPVPTPDSTGFSSPSTVSSSTTADSPAYDEFLAEFMSPATTTSSLSPDSTGLLEMLANGQDVCGQNGQGLAPKTPIIEHEATGNDIPPTGDDFLEHIMSDAYVTESPDLNAFDLFF